MSPSVPSAAAITIHGETPSDCSSRSTRSVEATEPVEGGASGEVAPSGVPVAAGGSGGAGEELFPLSCFDSAGVLSVGAFSAAGAFCAGAAFSAAGGSAAAGGAVARAGSFSSRATGAIGSGARSSAASACPVTQTGVCELVAE